MLCLSLHIAACNAAISSLLVAWSSNCCIAASSTESMVTSFKNFCTKGGGCRNWQLFSSCSIHVDYYWVQQQSTYTTYLALLFPQPFAHVTIYLSMQQTQDMAGKMSHDVGMVYIIVVSLVW